jgi:ribosomal protein S18 acetylase RimI-like enzyme
MDALKIRGYVREDLEGVVRVYNESFKNLHSCWPNPMTLEWFMKRFGAFLEARTGTVFVAQRGDVPVGYVLVTTQHRPEAGLVAYISGVCVVPSLQRQGMGTGLMKRALEWAVQEGAVLVENDDEIIENPGALRFFEKLGFEVFHRGACMSRSLESVDRFALPEGVTIRELQMGDLDELLTVRRESFREFGPWYSRPDGDAFKRHMGERIGRDDVRVCVAVMDNAVIGYVVCSVDETVGERGTIRNVSVLPERRNRGVGTALMVSALDFLRRRNVKTVDTVTETAEGFYRKVGFKVDARFVRVRKWLSGSG